VKAVTVTRAGAGVAIPAWWSPNGDTRLEPTAPALVAGVLADGAVRTQSDVLQPASAPADPAATAPETTAVSA
jgi:hypothetical protein